MAVVKNGHFEAMKNTSDFLKQGSLMFLAVAVFNAANLLYQLYMVRGLDTVDYGVLNTLFSILMIISVPNGALQTVVTKFVSVYSTTHHYGTIAALLGSFVKKVSVLGFVIFFLFLLGRGWIAEFIQIQSSVLILILGIVMLFSILLPLAQGGLQGLQRFGYLGFVMITNSGLKLFLGVLFVESGWGVLGAISALAVSVGVAFFLVSVILVKILFKLSAQGLDSPKPELAYPEVGIDFTEIHRYFYITATVFLCFMVLTNIDILLVKHYFDPLDAGNYSIAQMSGKIILFLPMAITMVMFPKVSRLHAQTKESRHLLKASLLSVGVLCGAAALVCLFFPGLILWLLTGREMLACVTLTRLFAVTMFFYALVYVLLFYHLSIHNMGFIYPLVLLTVLQLAAMVLFHQNLHTILYIMCGNALLLFMINLYIAFSRKRFNAAISINSDS